MKPTDELFDLIKTLSGSEKRYFKLSASVQKGSKNYLKLFDAIDSQKKYDENALRVKYIKESFVKNLTFTKNYLYKMIFKSLNSYSNEKSIDAHLNYLLNKCRILFDKALFQEFFKTVLVGKKTAERYERFGYFLEFLEMERQLTRKEDLKKKDMNDLYDQEIIVIEKLKMINSYKRAISNIYRIAWAEGMVRSKEEEEKVDMIFANEIFKNERQLSSLIAKERFYFALYLAHELKGNFKASYLYNKKRFSLISKNKPLFQKFIFDNYEESFRTLIISAANAGEYGESKSLLEDYYKAFKKKSIDDIDSLVTYYTVKLKKITDTLMGEEGFEESLEKFLIKYRGKLNIDVYNSTYYNLSRYFFVMGNYKEALRVINVLFGSKYLKHTPRVEPYTRILNILIHFESGNYRSLPHLISATSRYLKKKNKLFKTESIILKFLSNIIRKKNNEDIKREFVLLKKELSVIKNDRYENNALFYFDFLKWADKHSLNNINKT